MIFQCTRKHELYDSNNFHDHVLHHKSASDALTLLYVITLQSLLDD